MVTDEERRAEVRARAEELIARGEETLALPRPDPEVIREMDREQRARWAEEERALQRQAPAAPTPPAARPAGGAYVHNTTFLTIMEEIGRQFRDERMRWERRANELERRIAELEGKA